MEETAEQFSFQNALRVTGTSQAVLQNHEARNEFTPEQVLAAQWGLDHNAHYVFPSWSALNKPLSAAQAERDRVIKAFRRGHRAYTVSDLIRITTLRRLIFAGVAAAEASPVIRALPLNASSRNIARSLNSDPAWDEWLVFVPEEDLLVPVEPAEWVNRLWVAGEKPNTWRFAFTARGPEALAHVLARTRGRAAVVINLSALIRELLDRLDDLFPAVTSGGAN